MRRFLMYLSLSLKRAGKLLPRMIAVTLLLAVLFSLGSLLISRLQGDDAATEPVRIGIVGDLESGRLGEAVELLETMDSSRFSLRLLPMTEDEARDRLRRGEIDGFAVVPDGFARALFYGEHRPITYVSASGGAGIGAQLTREIAETVSALVLETENAVYGAQDLAAEELSGVDPYQTGDRLVLRYMLRIIDREQLYRVEELGQADALSLPGYYLCALPLLFLLLWAVGCCPYFAGRSRELGQILAAQGLGGAGQVAAEYLGYLLLMAFGVLTALLPAGLLLPRLGLAIPELQALGGAEKAGLMLRALPAALMLCAMQLMLYELSDRVVGAVLLQFLNAAVQGYVCGCFYPAVFFPEALRRLGGFLPVGTALRWLRSLLLGEPSRAACMAVWVWMLSFLAVAALVRARRSRS